MDFAKLGSFKVVKVLGLIMYKLDLLDSMRIIKIHYILVLKLVDPEVPPIKSILDINLKSQKRIWKIKKILI